MTHTSDLQKAVESWEESVRWIEKGWDCIEEYTHDLFQREILDEEIDLADKNEKNAFFPRIESADQRFMNTTEKSDNCVWSSPVEKKNGYNKTKHWYYYRWPKDLDNRSAI